MVQWISAAIVDGVYDGEEEKIRDWTRASAEPHR